MPLSLGQKSLLTLKSCAWPGLYTFLRSISAQAFDLLAWPGCMQFWTLAPLAFRAYYRPAYGSELVQWLALAQACLRDVVDKQHYSVDMILGVFVTWAVWTWVEWVYPPHSSRCLPRKKGALSDPLSAWVLVLVVAALGVAGVIVIGGKA